MASPIDERVLEAWLEFRRQGEPAALATLVRVDGSAPRPVGSQIAISGDGRTVGYITGGCAEAALAAEAQDAMAQGANRICRYGAGSPYFDVRLPCGAGIDVHFSVDLDIGEVQSIIDRLRVRRPATLAIDLSAPASKGVAAPRAGVFERLYEPATRIEIIGKGPVVPALAMVAAAAGMSVNVTSPEAETIALASAVADRIRPLDAPADYDPDGLDPWTAAAVLFHEHEWDPPILERLLKSECFYIGALGSRKTHSARLDVLRAANLSEDALAAINGPIGIDIHAKGPEEIAISIVAEIIEARRRGEHGRRWRR